MMFSAQNSSGAHWCRRRVRFNEVPEKVAEKVPGNPLLGIPPRFFFPRAAFSAGAWSCDSVYTGLSPDVLTAVILWSVPSCVESFYTGLSSVVRNPTCVLGVVKRLGDGWVGGNLHDCLGARSWPRGKG